MFWLCKTNALVMFLLFVLESFVSPSVLTEKTDMPTVKTSGLAAVTTDFVPTTLVSSYSLAGQPSSFIPYSHILLTATTDTGYQFAGGVTNSTGNVELVGESSADLLSMSNSEIYFVVTTAVSVHTAPVANSGLIGHLFQGATVLPIATNTTGEWFLFSQQSMLGWTHLTQENSYLVTSVASGLSIPTWEGTVSEDLVFHSDVSAGTVAQEYALECKTFLSAGENLVVDTHNIPLGMMQPETMFKFFGWMQEKFIGLPAGMDTYDPAKPTYILFRTQAEFAQLLPKVESEKYTGNYLGYTTLSEFGYSGCNFLDPAGEQVSLVVVVVDALYSQYLFNAVLMHELTHLAGQTHTGALNAEYWFSQLDGQLNIYDAALLGNCHTFTLKLEQKRCVEVETALK